MSYETINFGGFEIKMGLLKGGYRYNAFKKGTNNQYFKNHEFFKSKEELARLEDTPFITNLGRKGGSSSASAIINAIFKLIRAESTS